MLISLRTSLLWVLCCMHRCKRKSKADVSWRKRAKREISIAAAFEWEGRSFLILLLYLVHFFLPLFACLLNSSWRMCLSLAEWHCQGQFWESKRGRLCTPGMIRGGGQPLFSVVSGQEIWVRGSACSHAFAPRRPAAKLLHHAYGFPAPDGHTDATVSHRTVLISALYACGRTIMHVRRIVPIGAWCVWSVYVSKQMISEKH